jgi:hypothetical protein
MAGLRIFAPLGLGIALISCPACPAKPAFISSEIEGQAGETPGQLPKLIFCDLDGDGLKDAVLIEGTNLSIFYQDAKQGFTRRPQQQYRLEDRPALIWPARMATNAASLLTMTSDGVWQLDFKNRTGPPVRREIIHQKTIVPEKLDHAEVMHFPLLAETGTEWPLLLVPVDGGLQVWQHRDGWHLAQLIEQTVDTHIRPSIANPGYTRSFGLDMTVSDVNGDGRDDLMVARQTGTGARTYSLYLQKAGGLFASEPALGYTNKPDRRTALRWIDINRDGKVDLIKSTFLNEPYFVPGMRSGKVLVGAYLADDHGRIPAAPQQVFRKSDWSESVPVVDLDGDGFADLALGYIPLDTREGLRKMLTAKQLDVTVKFYFYRPGTGFPPEPDCQSDLLIHLDREFLFGLDEGLDLEQWVNFSGDFDGDGKRDMLVRDRDNEISAHFFISRQKGFDSDAGLKFHCPEPIESWQVEDLNNDGVSDLIVKLQKKNAFRIFTSQGK